MKLRELVNCRLGNTIFRIELNGEIIDELPEMFWAEIGTPGRTDFVIDSDGRVDPARSIGTGEIAIILHKPTTNCPDCAQLQVDSCSHEAEKCVNCQRKHIKIEIDSLQHKLRKLE
jgi:hypothetical protein